MEPSRIDLWRDPPAAAKAPDVGQRRENWICQPFPYRFSCFWGRQGLLAEQTRKGWPMTSTRLVSRLLVISLSCTLLLFGCEDGSAVTGDPLLKGAWVDGVQSGPIKIYVTELRFNDGSFEWTWDADLQQRGVYDTQDGILTVTVQHNYGSPQRLLGDYSSPYSIVGDTLTWGGSRYIRK